MANVAQLDEIAREGERFAAVLAPSVIERPVAACPGWRARELVVHLGQVQRWATGFIDASASEGTRLDEPEDDPAVDLAADALLSWFREGLDALVLALARATPQSAIGAFFPAPDPLSFWMRRQLLELTVHRVDAEDVAAQPRAAIAAERAIDGIDELLFGFGRRFLRRLAARPTALIGFEASDALARWNVRLGTDAGYEHARRGGDADLVVRAPAAELFLFLWNRSAAVMPSGDASLLEAWRVDAHI